MFTNACIEYEKSHIQGRVQIWATINNIKMNDLSHTKLHNKQHEDEEKKKMEGSKRGSQKGQMGKKEGRSKLGDLK